ncbi:MAG: hypothetical protein D8M59_03535 [Planctomycetes bacterium]|nr:hypothetical protein [Planctomycetota bacterium]
MRLARLSRGRLLVAVLAAGFLLTAAGVMGQEMQGQGRQGDEVRAFPVFDLEFPGGTVADFVDALRSVQPEANMVVDTGAETIPIPAMQLYSVDISRAVNVLDGLEYSDADGDLRIRVMAVPVVKNSTNYAGAARNPVFRVIVDSRYNRQAPQTSVVLTIADLLGEAYRADDVMTAIETAMSVITDEASRTEPAVLRFHDATGLLIARGTGEQLSAVKSVIDELREGLDRSRAASHPDTDRQLDQARSALEQSQRAVAERDDMLRGQMMELERCKARLEAITAELENLTARLRDVEAERDTYRTRIMILEGAQDQDPGRK